MVLTCVRGDDGVVVVLVLHDDPGPAGGPGLAGSPCLPGGCQMSIVHAGCRCPFRLGDFRRTPPILFALLK